MGHTAMHTDFTAVGNNGENSCFGSQVTSLVTLGCWPGAIAGHFLFLPKLMLNLVPSAVELGAGGVLD